MPVARPGRALALALPLAALSAAPLGAEEHALGYDCVTVTSPPAPTDHATALRVRRFDPALGVLLGADLVLHASVEGSAGLESLGAAPTTIQGALQATLSLRRPDQGALLEAHPAAAIAGHFGPFDGQLDFAGTSGKTWAGLSVAAAATLALAPADADLALFVGGWGAPGSVDLPLVVTGGSHASGPGNLAAQFTSAAGAVLQVCYRYAPDCNHNGVPDDADVAGGASLDLDLDGVPDECQQQVVSLCAGDGAANGGLDCPCGNNGPPGDGCLNGTGRGARLTPSGSASVANDTLVLRAAHVPWNAPGWFFYASTLANGADGAPFGHGINCLTLATPALKLDGGGALPAPGAPSLSSFLGASPGDVTYFQYWYRNAQGPCPGVEDLNASNALAITWGP